MESKKQLTKEERNLIKALIEKSGFYIPDTVLDNTMAAKMDDGGMGSLRLYPTDKNLEERKFGRRLSEITFQDEDKIDVVASLNLDSEDNLYELDIWKTNFDPLISFPDESFYK